ncbi:peptide-N4-asparagine amidase [Acidilobus saccharovorans]|nr:peptide-N4-asparagine amidase [Acidilobus saccharovorans]
MRSSIPALVAVLLAVLLMAPMAGAVSSPRAYPQLPAAHEAAPYPGPLNLAARDLGVAGNHDGYYSFQAFRYVPPNETPTVIWIGKNVVFNHTGLPYNATVYIPPGNYSLILLNMSIRELGGTQYDTVAYVFANGTPLLWGSTQEILNSTTTVDVTLFENLLRGPVRFQFMVPNGYAPSIGITGYYVANVSLLLYKGSPPPGLPNYFIPLFVNKLGYSMTPSINAYNDYVEQQVTIPNGTYRAWLILYTKGNAYDEFWYTNIPAVRYVKVYYNGHLAGVVNPFETIYTGGIDLFWWKPVPSINTLSFHMPDIVDLTPLLAYGLNATLAIHIADLLASSEALGVPGTEFNWNLGGVLLLWVNSSNPLVGAKVITGQASYHDSGPLIMNQGVAGLYFQEGASYFINYTSLLEFEHGQEVVSSQQEGVATVDQAYNYAGTFAYNYLDEDFTVSSWAQGYGPYRLWVSANWPVTLYYDFVAIPITPPTRFPYNATFLQNGSIALAPTYALSYAWPGYNFTESLNYDLSAVGGFAGILEFINPTGAVIIGLTSNNALTQKSLTAEVLVNGRGFEENAYLEGFQNSTVNTAGYLIANQFSYQLINGGLQ